MSKYTTCEFASVSCPEFHSGRGGVRDSCYGACHGRFLPRTLSLRDSWKTEQRWCYNWLLFLYKNRGERSGRTFWFAPSELSKWKMQIFWFNWKIHTTSLIRSGHRSKNVKLYKNIFSCAYHYFKGFLGFQALSSLPCFMPQSPDYKKGSSSPLVFSRVSSFQKCHLYPLYLMGYIVQWVQNRCLF